MPPIMPMSVLLSALRGAGRQHLTASTVAVRQAGTGSHVLRLHGYTQMIRKKVPNGEPLRSATFCVGGHDWRIICYPNGCNEKQDGYTSLFLTSLGPHHDEDSFVTLFQKPRGGLTARLEASVLDRAGKPSCTQTTEHRSFKAYVPWGWMDFAKNDDLDLVDDCLTILCTVTVDDLPLRAEKVTASPVVIYIKEACMRFFKI